MDKNAQLLYFVQDTIGQETFNAINDAMYQWYQASGYNLMKRDPKTRHTKTNYGTSEAKDGKNYIYKKNMGSTGYVGQNTYYWNTSTKILTESDIVRNTNYAFVNGAQSNCYDAYSVMLHELGHTVGLADISFSQATTAEKDAVMIGTARTNTTSYRTLRADDKSGAKSKYK